jgi:hypothetical protein
VSLLSFFCVPGDLTEFKSSSNATADATIKRPHANFSLKLSGDGTNNSYAEIQAPFNDDWLSYAPGDFGYYTDLYLTFYLYVDTRPAADSEQIVVFMEQTYKLKGELRLESGGALSIWRSVSGTVTRKLGTDPVSTGVWHRVEIRIGTNSSPGANDGACVLWLDGVKVIDSTMNCDDVVHYYTYLGNYNRRSSSAFTIYMSDISLSNSDFSGSSEIYYSPAYRQGTTFAWTGSFSDVGEIGPNDGDTTKISHATAGTTQSETPGVKTCSQLGLSAGDVVVAVKPMMWARKASGTSIGLRYRFRMSGAGTNFDSLANEDPGSAYVLRSALFLQEPVESIDWYQEAFDDINVGPVLRAVSGGGTAYCTMIGAAVLVQPVSPVVKAKYTPHAGI